MEWHTGTHFLKRRYIRIPTGLPNMTYAGRTSLFWVLDFSTCPAAPEHSLHLAQYPLICLNCQPAETWCTRRSPESLQAREGGKQGARGSCSRSAPALTEHGASCTISHLIHRNTSGGGVYRWGKWDWRKRIAHVTWVAGQHLNLMLSTLTLSLPPEQASWVCCKNSSTNAWLWGGRGKRALKKHRAVIRMWDVDDDRC